MSREEAIERVASGLRLLSEKETSNFIVDGVRPKAVVEADSEEDVAMLLKSASEEGVTVIPWGGGTMMGLGNIPRSLDIVVSLRRLNKIIEYSPEDLVVTSGAGLTLGSLQSLLAKNGQSLPLDPPYSDDATLGGIVSSNAFGPLRYLYGGVRDLLLGVRVAGTNGALMGFGGKVVKNVAGYDVKKLFVGSLGTLGIITQTTFRLYALPEFEGSFISVFNSLDDASKAIQEILRNIHSSIGIGISSIEMLDPNFWRIFKKSDNLEGYALAVRVLGVTKAALMRRIKELEELTKHNNCAKSMILDGSEHLSFWKEMQNHPRIASKLSTRCKISTLISRVPDVIRVIHEKGKIHEVDYCIIAHPGLGMLHAYFHSEDYNNLLRVLIDLRSYVVSVGNGSSLVIESAPLEIKRLVDVWGPVRKDFMLMKAIKNVFDPRGILCPGRYVGGI
jgi:glycolate oxidase FAD binding subunit